jgi:hypothetical protein
MKNLKNTVAAVAMMAVMVFGTTFANAGIIIAGRTTENVKTSAPDPCSGTGTDIKSDVISELGGIIIAGFGIIIAGRGGIIIAGLNNEPVVNCGIIIAGKS